MVEMRVRSLAPLRARRYLGGMGWCQGLAEPRVPPFCSPHPWLGSSSALCVWRCPHLCSRGVKPHNALQQCLWKGLALRAQKSAPHVQLTKQTGTKSGHLRELAPKSCQETPLPLCFCGMCGGLSEISTQMQLSV